MKRGKVNKHKFGKRKLLESIGKNNYSVVHSKVVKQELAKMIKEEREKENAKEIKGLMKLSHSTHFKNKM